MTSTQNQTDHELKAAIEDELTWTPEVRSDQIGVAVTDGAVTLSGQVASYPEKEAALHGALRVRGVNAVADQIVVQNAEGDREDADIAREAAVALKLAVTVPDSSVTATVYEHVVTLSGTVAWQYEREAARQALATLPGVTDVRNEIVLKPPVVISASTAMTNITSAFVRNARLDARHVHIDIDGTEIRLTGKVRSWTEQHQAEYAAWCTPGVTHVKNELTIGN